MVDKLVEFFTCSSHGQRITGFVSGVQQTGRLSVHYFSAATGKPFERNHSLRSGTMPFSPPLHHCACLASGLWLDHNDSSVSGVESTLRQSPFARKESPHEDHTLAPDTSAATHVGRPAAPQLLPRYHALLSPLCR